MTGSESRNVWAPLQRELSKLRWHHQRLEQLGIPDVTIYVPARERDVWIEMKYVETEPPAHKRSSITIKLRMEQKIWLYEASEAGREVYMLIRVANLTWYLISDPQEFILATETQNWLEFVKRNAHRQFSSLKSVLRYIEIKRWG